MIVDASTLLGDDLWILIRIVVAQNHILLSILKQRKICIICILRLTKEDTLHILFFSFILVLSITC